MLARRAALCVVFVGLSALLVGEVGAQGRDRSKAPSIMDDKQSVPCPECDKLVDFDINSALPTTCPHCKAKIKIEKKGEEGWTIASEKVNPLKKILLIVGGSVLGLALLGVLLKYTVFAPAKPKKNKKKRRDDDDEEDDRPRKRKRPVVEDDEEEERPRKVRKPRIVEDDDE